MENVTLLAVKHAALLLIETNNQTTTLEVKGLLRDLGYFAEQDEISKFMEDAAQELPLTFIPGPFRTFTLPPVAAVAAVVNVGNAAAVAVTDAVTDDPDDEDTKLPQSLEAAALGISQALLDAASVKYTSRKGELVLMYNLPSTITNLGGSITRKSTSAGRTFFFAQPIRRELARSAHASILQIHKNLTCSSKVIKQGTF